MRPRLVALPAVALLLCTAGAAFAQPMDVFPPSFATLDRADGRSLAGLDAGFTVGDVSSQRFDVHGQFVSSAGLGGYVSLPIAHASNGTGLGNTDLGAIFALRNLLTLRAGIVLPTSSDDGSMAAQAAQWVRLTDVVQSFKDVTALRLSVSPMVRSGTLFVRADLGGDIVLSKPSGSPANTLVRGNLGVGWDGGVVVFTGEFVNNFDTGSGSIGARFSHSVAAQARLRLGGVEPSVAYVYGLDKDARDNYSSILIVGLQFVAR